MVRWIAFPLTFVGALVAGCGGGSGGGSSATGGSSGGDVGDAAGAQDGNAEDAAAQDDNAGDAAAIADAAADAANPDSLAALGLFTDPVAQTPAGGVIPYDVIAVLFADRSGKLRFVSIPAGTRATYDPMDFWDYPDGTRFVKTFFYYHDARDPSQGRRLIETRIIERQAGTWTGRTYLWNDEQTEAVRLKVGKTLSVSWTDATGTNVTQDYRVPNDNECKTCHSKDHIFQPLGPRTRQLNRGHDYGVPGAPRLENQIDHLAALGLVDGTIPPVAERFTLSDPYGGASFDERARSYLDANCSHCHRPGGEAGSSALDLRKEVTDPYALGTCREPVEAGPGSGGHTYDVVPGNPDDSIMIFRVKSTIPDIKMPEVPTLMSDADGAALLDSWIAAMPPTSCNGP